MTTFLSVLRRVHRQRCGSSPTPRRVHVSTARRQVTQRLAASSLLFLGFFFGVPALAYADTPVCHIGVFEGTVTAVDCPDSSIASYKYKDGATLEGGFEKSLPQTLFNSGATSASLPLCGPWQADVFTGPVLPVIDADNQYKERLLAHLEGDAGVCEVEATTTTTTTTTTSTPAPQEEATPPTPKAEKLARTGSGNAVLGVVAGFLLMIGGVSLATSIRIEERVS